MNSSRGLRRRSVLDVWFVLLPVWAIPLYVAAILRSFDDRRLPLYEHTGYFAVLFTGLMLLTLSAFWCCVALDRILHRGRKLFWYIVVLGFPPVGCALCWFLVIRDESPQGRPDVMIRSAHDSDET